MALMAEEADVSGRLLMALTMAMALAGVAKLVRHEMIDTPIACLNGTYGATRCYEHCTIISECYVI
jgi:hypothetical protein